MLRLRPLLLLLGTLALGCLDSDNAEVTPLQPTLVAIEPSEFRGIVPCSAEPGGMASYVATFYEVERGSTTGPGVGLALQSSPPVTCLSTVGSHYVTPGNYYAVDIVAFDRPACDGSGRPCVQPLIAGAPIMVDQDGALVTPRWSTSCGRAGTPAISEEDYTVYVRGCAPLVESGAPTATQVVVDPRTALGGACDSAEAPVSFTVVPDDRTLAESTLACGELATFADLLPGRTYEFTLRAFQADQLAATSAARCTAQAQRGVTVTATCSSLSTMGVARIELGDLFAGQSCSSDLKAVYVSGPGDQIRELRGESCTQPLLIEAPAGATTFQVTSESVAGGPGPSYTCSAAVAPGETALVSCTAPTE